MVGIAWQKPARTQLALWKSLNREKSRRRERLFLAEGFKVVSELLKSTYRVRALLVMEQKKTYWETFLTSIPREADRYCLTAAQWQILTQDQNPEGIMAITEMVSPADLIRLPERGNILLAYRTNNPNNLGALMRAAHWFGFATLLMSADSVDYTNPKVVRTSMGSLFHLNVLSGVDFAAFLPGLKMLRYHLVVGHSGKGVAPHPFTGRIALLLGSESHGLPDHLTELAEEVWHIPGAGSAESLSLPQAAAIMMYEASKTAEAACHG